MTRQEFHLVSIATGLVADVGSRDKPPDGVVQTPHFLSGWTIQAVPGESERFKSLIKKRIGEIGRKRIKT